MQHARIVRLVSSIIGLACLVAGPAQAAGTLKLLRVTPAGSNVPPGQEIVFKFDRPVVPIGSMARAPADVPVRIDPALHCMWRWLDTDELACRLPHAQRFRPATRYTIRVGTTLKALDGTHLAQPQTHQFTTELPAANWANFRGWRSPVTPVYLMTFNLPVTAAAVGRSVAFVPDGGSTSTPARAEPFQKERTGPLLLPVPGVPGAMIWIENPQPVKPEDADKPAYAARKTWRVTPLHPLASAADYTLRLRPGLTTPLGSLPGTGGLPGDTGFVTYGPFRFRGVICTLADGGKLSYSPGAAPPQSRCRPGSVQLLFSAPVPLSTLAAARWTPSPASSEKIVQAWNTYPQWRLGGSRDAYGAIHGHAYALPFDFDPMQSYRVAVPAGVKDRFGRRLAASATASFATGHFPPAIDTSAAGGVLEQTQDTVLPVRFTNLDKLDFSYRTLNAAGLQAGAAASVPVPASVSLLASFDGQAPADRHLAVPLGIRSLLAGGSGVVSGMLSWAPKINQRGKGESPVFGEVTPWQAFAKLGHFGTLVWITSLATGAPVADVKVRLYRAFPKALNAIEPASITARTGVNGLAVLPGTAVLGSAWTQRATWNGSDKKYWYLGAVKQGAMGLLPLDWSYQRSVGDASDYALYSATAPANGHVRVWALTAQGVYRPGATVHYAAFVRGESNTALKAAPKLTYTLTITDPTGNDVVTRDNVMLSAFGGLHGDLTIPANAATGWYSIQLAWPVEGRMQTREAGRFLVTDFVPASFKVQTLLAGSLFGPGMAVKAEAQARLHAGGPYTQARVRFNVRLQPAAFAPETPVAAGFGFDANPDNAPDTATLYQTGAHLDQSGNVDMHATLPGKTDIVYGNLVVQSAVESERGTWIADRATALYAARDRFVGLKLDDWLLHAGRAATVHYLVTDAKGTPQAGSVVKLTLERQKVTVTNVADGSGGFEQQNKTSWVEEAHCQAISQAQPGTCKLTPAHAGSYRVVATVTDTQGRTQQSTLGTWAVGPGVVLWKPSAHVTLVPDKKSYHAGDIARVLVQNPYPGARALVTVERYGILWKKVVTLEGSTPVLDVPIKPDFFPGAYLSVAIFSPRVAKPAKKADLGKPTLALGYVTLPVTGTGSSLAVIVKPAHTEYKPRQSVDVRVAVKNTADKPAAHTRLVAAVVDEAVLDLLQGGAGYYDPRKAFYTPPDGPDVLNYSLLSKLGTTHYIKVTGSAINLKKGVTPGGGGGSALSIRSIFKYTADWHPALETDAQGHAHFHFKLPDNLTGWRIVVMALTPGAAMGVGAATVRVNLPLQLGPALPNQVHTGDRFEAGFSVTNRTKTTHKVAVQIGADGAGVNNAHHATTLDLAPYTHKLAWLDVAPSTPGVLEFLATARSGKLGDALKKQVPVKTAGAAEVAAEYGSLTTAAAKVPVKLPANALPGSAKLTVTLAPTALANLAGAFTHMRDDPLDAWEVRLSRAVMASDYLAVHDALPASVTWPDAAGEISNDMQHAADFQAPNGGMGFWIPRNEFVSPYLSVYTALAFDWLQAAGHPVPSDVRDKLISYLNNVILAAKPDDYEHNAPILKAAAMAALALHGQLKDGQVAGLLPQLPRLSLFGKSLLLQAALATHDTSSARRITTALLTHTEETGGSISFQETWADAYSSLLATPLRANCAVLDALVAARNGPDVAVIGDLPDKLLRWIDARRSTGGGWPNSQENVFCTTAAVHYAAAYETPVQALKGQVTASGRDVGKARFASRRSAPQSVSAAAPASAATVTVSHGGTGRLYYGVRLVYELPPQSVGPVDAGFSVTRQYYVQRGGDWVRLAPDAALARGDIVRVDLTVDVPAERHYVVLSDPLPGAFEAVNHQLHTADATAPTRSDSGTTLWFDNGAWPNYAIVTGGFYHRETAFDAVRFYADDLPPGHYHLIYAAQVIAPGRFLAPAPQIEEIYQPDVFGRGEATQVTVASPADTR